MFVVAIIANGEKENAKTKAKIQDLKDQIGKLNGPKAIKHPKINGAGEKRMKDNLKRNKKVVKPTLNK